MNQKSQDKKNTILHTTLELIAEQGFHGTSVSQIAEKAGINVGSMYYYFTNKDDILHALYMDCKARITQHAFHNCAGDIPPDECLKRMIWNLVSYFIQNKAVIFYVEQYENSPYFSDSTAASEYADIMKPYMELYERLNRQRLIKDLPVELIQSLLYGSITSLTKRYLNSEDSFDESVLSAAIDAIWDMIQR